MPAPKRHSHPHQHHERAKRRQELLNPPRTRAGTGLAGRLVDALGAAPGPAALHPLLANPVVADGAAPARVLAPGVRDVDQPVGRLHHAGVAVLVLGVKVLLQVPDVRPGVASVEREANRDGVELRVQDGLLAVLLQSLYCVPPVVVEHQQDGPAVQHDRLHRLVGVGERRGRRGRPAAPVVAGLAAPHVRAVRLVAVALPEEGDQLAGGQAHHARLHQPLPQFAHARRVLPALAAVHAAPQLAVLAGELVGALWRVVNRQQPLPCPAGSPALLVRPRLGSERGVLDEGPRLRHHHTGLRAPATPPVLRHHLHHVARALLHSKLLCEQQPQRAVAAAVLGAPGRGLVQQPDRVLKAGARHRGDPLRRVPAVGGGREAGDVNGHHLRTLHAAEPRAQQRVARGLAGPRGGVAVVVVRDH
mmetsp:Transcript_48745/g.123078  ORF Transcript_48745/g.123078 Transcript_48745/m.123078 type:complete len:418 (-) Transcript_48745:493-1746(-)